MSMYGESRQDWNYLYVEISDFLVDHSISEILEIVHDCVERKECEVE